jgi:hypothetical protein
MSIGIRITIVVPEQEGKLYELYFENEQKASVRKTLAMFGLLFILIIFFLFLYEIDISFFS